MQIFLDTANVEEIEKGVATGVVAGVTTNPSIISRENMSFEKCVEAILAVDLELIILLEVIATDTKGMVEEARKLSKITEKVVVKIPMTASGLAAVKILSRENISTAVTLVFSPNQAIAASCAGADFVAPFVGRLDDINADGIGLVKSIKQVFDTQQASTKIISASLRTPQAVSELFCAGSDIVTMSGEILHAMFNHPLTDLGLEKFMADWKKVPSE